MDALETSLEPMSLWIYKESTDKEPGNILFPSWCGTMSEFLLAGLYCVLLLAGDMFW